MGKNKLGKLRKQIAPTLKKHNVIRASVFGSFARGEETKKSDIDLLVQFSGRKSLLDLVGLELELKDELKRDVDVITFGSLHHLIKDRVLKEQVQII
ncbi:MAG: nucleotidyltransferase family protein [bacterium]|nr:nucleotidyltransferase family protein [bacterium]